jgi:hypothetical protein
LGSYYDNGWFIRDKKPSNLHVWDNNAKQWVISIENARTQAWEVVRTRRDKEEFKPFIYNGDLYDSNKLNISGAVQMALLAKISNQPFSIDWTLYDNSVKTFNADQMMALGAALGEHINKVYDTTRVLREQIDAATTKEGLDAIVWPE